MQEIWKPAKGFEGLYEVSNMGRVKSLPRKTTSGGIMKLYTNKKNGYQYVCLCKDNKVKNRRVHILVMEAFTDYKSNGFDVNAVVDHIDGDKTNNKLDNLQVVTQYENDSRARAMKKQSYYSIPVIDLDTKEVFKSFTDASHSVGGKQGEMVRRVCDGERSHYRNHRFARLADYENNAIPAYKGKIRRKASEGLWQ